MQALALQESAQWRREWAERQEQVLERLLRTAAAAAAAPVPIPAPESEVGQPLAGGTAVGSGDRDAGGDGVGDRDGADDSERPGASTPLASLEPGPEPEPGAPAAAAGDGAAAVVDSIPQREADTEVEADARGQQEDVDPAVGSGASIGADWKAEAARGLLAKPKEAATHGSGGTGGNDSAQSKPAGGRDFEREREWEREREKAREREREREREWEREREKQLQRARLREAERERERETEAEREKEWERERERAAQRQLERERESESERRRQAEDTAETARDPSIPPPVETGAGGRQAPQAGAQAAEAGQAGGGKGQPTPRGNTSRERWGLVDCRTDAAELGRTTQTAGQHPAGMGAGAGAVKQQQQHATDMAAQLRTDKVAPRRPTVFVSCGVLQLVP